MFKIEQLDRVTVTRGMKINKGNFETENFSVTYASDVQKDEDLDEAFQRVRNIVNHELNELLPNQQQEIKQEIKIVIPDEDLGMTKEEFEKAQDAKEAIEDAGFKVEEPRLKLVPEKKPASDDVKKAQEYDKLIDSIHELTLEMPKDLWQNVAKSMLIIFKRENIDQQLKDLRRINNKLIKAKESAKGAKK